jgi:ribosome-associated protein
MIKEDINTKEFLDFLISKIDDKKGEDIKILDLQKLENSVSDYFVICSANSKTQAQTISDYIIHETRNFLHKRPISVEGEQNAFWILIDYGTVVIHIFQPEYREFYDLEGLWGDVLAEAIE